MSSRGKLVSMMAKFPQALIGLALAASLAGCGTPSQSLNMNITGADTLQLRTWVPDALKFNVQVGEIKGGSSTSRWWGSQVSAMAFQQALEDSLHSLGMMPVTPDAPARFELRAEMIGLVQPLIAADTEVTASVRYQLIEKSSGKVLYERVLRTKATAEFTEAMLSQPERTRLANEDTMRKNIVMALRDLMALRIEPPAPQ